MVYILPSQPITTFSYNVNGAWIKFNVNLPTEGFIEHYNYCFSANASNVHFGFTSLGVINSDLQVVSNRPYFVAVATVPFNLTFARFLETQGTHDSHVITSHSENNYYIVEQPFLGFTQYSVLLSHESGGFLGNVAVVTKTEIINSLTRHPIHYSHSAGCTITGPADAPSGQDVVVTVNVQSGYQFKGASGVRIVDALGDNVPFVVNGNQFSFTMPQF